MKKVIAVSFLSFGFAVVGFLLFCIIGELELIRQNMEQNRIAQCQPETNQNAIVTSITSNPLPPGANRYPIMEGSYCFTGNTITDENGNITEAEIVFENGFKVKIPVPSDWLLEPVCKVDAL